MGVLYHIQPFDEDMAEFLAAMDAQVPEAEPARNPTPAEVRDVCSKLTGYRVEYNVKPKSHWQAIIDGPKDQGTLLNVEKFKGLEEKPHTIWFEKGTPSLILEIVRELAKQCGPLVVVPDTGEAPIAVTGTASVKRLLQQWEHTHEC